MSTRDSILYEGIGHGQDDIHVYWEMTDQRVHGKS
jgi:hypothetical protein